VKKERTEVHSEKERQYNEQRQKVEFALESFTDLRIVYVFRLTRDIFRNI